MGLLEYIRSRDTATKAQISLLVAIVVTLLIAGVWLSTFSARFSPVSLNSQEEESIAEEYTESRSIGDIIGKAKSQLGGLINAKNEIESVLNEEIATYEAQGGDVSSATGSSSLGALTSAPETNEEMATSTAVQDESMILSEHANATHTPLMMVNGPETPALTQEPRVIRIGTSTRQNAE